MNTNKLNRKELQELCKLHGIKANLSNEEMIKCLQKKANHEEIPYKCKKLTWFDKNKSEIGLCVSMSALAVSLFCLYSIKN
ncbi:hypothetical protein Klosneuvirus_6_4 [Klosneuvirus KNV1]|uniref:SAP domain-containing protein n=1 Tax=Klosneuvirus KNV1 TaxID=1977640 RepID=A0A1V0SL48_9VIRU|nr:hypothetical protein Klosneuvirus_6_4 [Klosneuvirus KNV1]